MATDLLRRKAALRVVTATVITLMLALPTANSQTSPAKSKQPTSASPSTEADIDAFLSDLDKKASAPAATPAAAQPTGEASAAAAQQAPEPTGSLTRPRFRPALFDIDDDATPFSTLSLMIGGIILCALATVGLTLTFFALRKDMRRRKRGHRRRFSKSKTDGSANAAHH